MKISKFETIINYSLDPIKISKDAVVPFNVKSMTRKPTMDYGNRGYFMPSEFNLAEIGIIEDVESYVRQSFQKKTALMFKEGEDFTGKNKKTINYIKKRIKQFERVTNIPWRTLLRQTGYYLISRSNFFWVIVRDEKLSGGRKVGNKKPIAGFFPMAPETVEIKKNINTGRIEKYQQRMPDGRKKEFSPDDVIHFTAYKKEGFMFGTPAIISVKDDIRALRRIEENIELLIYQTLFPIFHYKVGTETKPAGKVQLDDGTVVDEVDYVRLAIANMPSEGGIVTPERHEIEYIGAEGKTLRAESYLEHFKRRVFAGLATSSVDFGEGETANRATADNMSRTLVDSVKDYQDILAEQINHFVIAPLLIESTFRNLDFYDDDNAVTFVFKEIDIETQLKKNVNAQLLYGGNIIDIDETRQVAGYEPLTKDQEKKLFTARVTIPEMEVKTKADEKKTKMTIEGQKEISVLTAAIGAEVQAGTTTTKTSKSPTGGTSKSVTKVNKSVSNKIKAMSAPKNQHGTKTGPQKSRLDSFQDALAVSRWKSLKADIISNLNKQDLLDISWIDTLVGIAMSDLRDQYLKVIEREIFSGFRDVKQIPSLNSLIEAKAIFTPGITGYINNLSSVLRQKLRREFNSLTTGFIPKSELVSNISELFDKMEYRLRFFDTTERDRGNNIGRAFGLKQKGKLLAGVSINDKCPECMEQDNLISIESIIPEDIPPSHSNCSCKVHEVDFTKEEERCILNVKRQMRATNPDMSIQEINSSAIATCRASK